MMRTTLLLILFFQSIYLRGQFAGENSYLTSLTNNTQKSSNPTFSTVDEAHGTLNVSIPLYVIEYAGISIPITLSYVAEGIRTDQRSTEVGLGWTLSSVGAIKRNVLGFPDEGKIGTLDWNYTFDTKSDYSYDSSEQLPPCLSNSEVFVSHNPSNADSFLNFRRGWLRHGIKPEGNDNWFPTDIGTIGDYYPGPESEWFDCSNYQTETFKFYVDNNYFDLQPDWFVLSGPFAQGNFFLKKNSDAAADNLENLNCVFVPLNNAPKLDVKFQYDDLTDLDDTYNNNFGALKPFVLRTKDAIHVKYDEEALRSTSFNLSRYSSPYALIEGDDLEFANTWYPTLITNMLNNKQVHVSYTNQFGNDQQFLSQVRKSESPNNSTLTTTNDGQRLVSTIEYDNGQVDFYYDHALRLDNSNLPALTSIVVQENNQIVRTIEFTYGHMGCSGNLRLMLEGITIIKDGEQLETISFNYLDNQHCFSDGIYASKDHWGFPNEPSTEGDFEELGFWNQSNSIPGGYSYGTANKISSLDKTSYGVLQGFNSSSGFREEYTFGLHEIWNTLGLDNPSNTWPLPVGGLRIERILSDDGNSQSIEKEYIYNEGYLKTRPNYLSQHDNNGDIEVYHFNTPQGNSYFTDYGHVVYKKVVSNIVSQEDEDEPFPNGKVVNEYEYLQGVYNVDHPYPAGVNKDWTSGYLKKQSIFDSAGNLLFVTDYLYDEFSTGIEIKGYKPSLPSIAFHAEDLNKYTIYADYFLPVKTEFKEYNDGEVINQTTTELLYNEGLFDTNRRDEKPIELVTTLTSGEQIRKVMKYSSSYVPFMCVTSQQWQNYASDDMVKSLRYMRKFGLTNFPVEESTYFRKNAMEDWTLLNGQINLYKVAGAGVDSKPVICSIVDDDVKRSFDEIPVFYDTNFPNNTGATWSPNLVGADNGQSYTLNLENQQNITVTSSFLSSNCMPCNRAIAIRLHGHAGSFGNNYDFLVTSDDNGQTISSPTQLIPSGLYHVKAQIILSASCATGFINDFCPDEIVVNLSGNSQVITDLDLSPSFPSFHLHEIRTTDLENPLSIETLSSISNESMNETFSYNQAIFNKKVSSDFSYNDYNSITEGKNSDGIFTSSLLDLTTKRIIGQISNGKLSTSRYTSFENNFHGGWEPVEDYTSATDGPSYAISGDHYYKLNGNQFNSITGGNADGHLPSGTYLLSYYSTGNESVFLSASGSIISESSKVVGEWVYNEKVVKWTTEGNWITMSGTGFLDELRLHEIDAVMTTQGYYPDGKLQYKVSPSGEVITYEYDAKGRLEWVVDTERYALQNHEYGEKDILDEDSYNSHTTLTAKREDMSKVELTGNDAGFISKAKSVTYTDGFGRHRQTVDVKATFNGRDRISFSRYDDFGRETKRYLPYYPSNSDATHGPFRTDYLTEQAAYYNLGTDMGETQYPFAEVELEPSPLQRPIEQGSVGEDFQLGDGHNVQIEYGWNEASQVRKWTYDHSTGEVTCTGFYPANVLSRVTTTDQNGIESSEWTDARGRLVARGSKIRVSGSDFNTSTSESVIPTYQISNSVYDDFGRVVMEISAYANAKMPCSSAVIDPFEMTAGEKELIAWYKYDSKGRVIERHSPGLISPTHYVYNKYDQVVMSQTHEQRSMNPDRWSFVKFDSRHRTILNGECQNNASRTALQGQIDGDDAWHEAKVSSGGIFGYTNDAIPSISAEDVFNAYFFDDYDFPEDDDFPVPSSFSYTAFGGFTSSNMTRGLPTGSKTRVFQDDAPVDFLNTVLYYDDDGRPLQAYTENHKGGYDRIDTWYNDRGQVDKTEQTHLYESSSDEVTYTTDYVYHERTGQLKDTWVTVNDDAPVLVSQKFYKNNGSLSSNKLHRRTGPDASSNNSMQVMTYRYNERGQLTHINNPSLIVDAYNFEDYDVFGQEIMFEDPSEEYDPNQSEWPVTAQYNGNISTMVWNVKDPDADGAMEIKHAYVYEYDDIGNMTKGRYAAELPATAGAYMEEVNLYSELASYNIGGNMKTMKRYGKPSRGGPAFLIDDLSYTYENSGYRLKVVNDNALDSHVPNVKHFIDGSNDAEQYRYDQAMRVNLDKNREVSINYNRIGLPSKITPYGLPGTNELKYMYDAANNKLQKYVDAADCDPTNPGPCVTTTDYIGNFVYENGELKMIYHPEGVIRPTPPSAENDTEFVFDYFIKDYLGNVRVVMTEEDATFTEKFLATLEDVHAQIEEINFENLDEVREDLPTGYPVNGSVSLNERIALLNAANGTEIGPSIVLPVRRGEKVSLSAEYFYTEDAPGATYDNIDFLINEILIALAAGGSGILPLNETQLIDVASGQWNYGSALENLFNNEIDTTDMSRPYAYLVWTAYDAQMNIVPSASGIERVSSPNDLELLMRNDIPIQTDGYLHAYVSNGSAVGVNFDNFLVTTMRGKVRQINHYYPYGLTIHGIGTNSDEYLNKYTTKELQTGEWNPALSNGLEMYDFHARHYDPQLGRWFAPDPAEQFSNPYLAMGNNPVMYVDPDGEWVFIAAMAITGGYIGGSVANNTFNPGDWDWSSPGTYVGIGIGAAAGGFGAAKIGAGVKAGTISKTKLVSNLYTGGLNALYNYQPEQDVVTTLSYFASGYGAAAVGSFAAGGGAPLWEAKLASSLVGGMGNLAVAGMSGEISDGITTPLQAFTGGAVVGYSGMSLHAKKAGLKSKYLFGKGSDKLLTRGLSNMATNYAFTDPEDWSKMTGSQRWGSPFFYGVVGHAAERAMPFDGIENSITNRLIFSGISVAAYGVAYGAEYAGMTFSKGYYNEFKDAKYGKWKKKARIIGWKSLFYGLPLK
jgi:RHS repeat-associated protein